MNKEQRILYPLVDGQFYSYEMQKPKAGASSGRLHGMERRLL
jgi:hypothetical protein